MATSTELGGAAGTQIFALSSLTISIIFILGSATSTARWHGEEEDGTILSTDAIQTAIITIGHVLTDTGFTEVDTTASTDTTTVQSTARYTLEESETIQADIQVDTLEDIVPVATTTIVTTTVAATALTETTMVAAVLTETTTEVETVQAETTIVAETDQAETTMEVETMAAVPMVISMVVEAGQATTQEAVQATFALVSPVLTAPDVWQLQDVADKQLDTI